MVALLSHSDLQAMIDQENPAMISDTEARRIASDWHGGGGSALYAFASTGAIDTARADHDIAHELTETAKSESRIAPEQRDDPAGFTNLINLRTYCRRHGKRGPVPGWADLTR